MFVLWLEATWSAVKSFRYEVLSIWWKLTQKLENHKHIISILYLIIQIRCSRRFCQFLQNNSKILKFFYKILRNSDKNSYKWYEIIKFFVVPCSVPLVPIPEQNFCSGAERGTFLCLKNRSGAPDFLFRSGMFRIVPETAFPEQSSGSKYCQSKFKRIAPNLSLSDWSL